MTELEKKRDIAIYLNTTSFETAEVLNLLGNEYSKDLKNFAEIYKKKLEQLEKYFQSNRISIYSENVLTHMIFMYFEALFLDANNILKSVSDNISKLSPNFILNKPLMQLMLLPMDKYRKRCDLISNFSLEKDIKLVIAVYFETIKFNSVDELEFKYKELQDILIRLGLVSLAFNLDDIALSIIEQAKINPKVTPAMCVKKIGSIF